MHKAGLIRFFLYVHKITQQKINHLNCNAFFGNVSRLVHTFKALKFHTT